MAQGDVKGGIGQLIDKVEEDPVTAIATVVGGWHALKGAGLKTQEFYRDGLYARSKGWMNKSEALRKAGQTKEAYLALKKGMALRSAGDTVTVKLRAVFSARPESA